MATLSEMTARVRFMSGAKAQIDSQIENNINEAMYQLSWELRPPEAVTSATASLSDGTYSYTFSTAFSATDVYAPFMMRNVTDERLMHMGSLEEFETLLQVGDDATGEPTKWIRVGNGVYIYKSIPDDETRTVRLWYVKRLAEMTASTDTFPLNDEWIKPVEVLAAAMTLADLNNYQGAQMKQAEYVSLVNTRQLPQQIEDEAPEGSFVFVSNPVR